MRISSILVIAVGSLATSALPTESSATKITLEAVKEGPFPNSKDQDITTARSKLITADLEKRADWCTSGSNYNQDNATELQRQLQNDNPNGLSYLPAWSTVSWSLGTAKVCISNQYLSDNTHIKRWEAGWAMGYREVELLWWQLQWPRGFGPFRRNSGTKLG
ncbi:secreted protein [Colletotrichum tofieldiae]|nr:secreted protein [Colletotrichum tofieldiae]